VHAPTILKSRFSRAFCAHSDANNWSDWFIPTLIEGLNLFSGTPF